MADAVLSVFVYLFYPTFTQLLLDEPKAYLHQPTAYSLGKNLSLDGWKKIWIANCCYWQPGILDGLFTIHQETNWVAINRGNLLDFDLKMWKERYALYINFVLAVPSPFAASKSSPSMSPLLMNFIFYIRLILNIYENPILVPKLVSILISLFYQS